jgi:hypothetical protein
MAMYVFFFQVKPQLLSSSSSSSKRRPSLANKRINDRLRDNWYWNRKAKANPVVQKHERTKVTVRSPTISGTVEPSDKSLSSPSCLMVEMATHADVYDTDMVQDQSIDE